MLSIGVVGLGKIAQKAYLPIYSGLQGDVQWFLQSRDLEKLTRLSNQYRMAAVGTSVDKLDELHLDAVMIHAATPAHYELVKHFLERGVHVFVDKPLALSMEEVTELYLLAKEHEVLLMVGFNRRFVPMMQQLYELPHKNAIRVVKNRINKPRPAREAIFDELIHPLDTALALAGFPAEPKARFALHRNQAGELEQASVIVTAAGVRATAELNLVAGANVEEATVATTQGIYTVKNLSQLAIENEQGMTVQAAPDWEDTLVTRGFEPMVTQFIRAVEQNGENPVGPITSRLTHQLLTDLADQIVD